MWFSDFDWSWSFKSVPQMLPDFRISRHIATLRPLGVEPLSAQLLKTAPTQVILHLICIEFGYTGFPYTGNIWTSQSIGFGWLWRSSHSGLDFGLSLIHLFAALLQKGCTPGKKNSWQLASGATQAIRHRFSAWECARCGWVETYDMTESTSINQPKKPSGCQGFEPHPDLVWFTSIYNKRTTNFCSSFHTVICMVTPNKCCSKIRTENVQDAGDVDFHRFFHGFFHGFSVEILRAGFSRTSGTIQREKLLESWALTCGEGKEFRSIAISLYNTI